MSTDFTLATIRERIDYKIISLVFKCIHRGAPPYLERLVNTTHQVGEGLDQMMTQLDS